MAITPSVRPRRARLPLLGLVLALAGGLAAAAVPVPAAAAGEAAAAASYRETPPYTAMVTTDLDGRRVVARIHSDGIRTRTESTTVGGTSIILSDPVAGRSWLYLPGEAMATEADEADHGLIPDPVVNPAIPHREEGREMVMGENTLRMAVGGPGKGPFTGRVWRTEDGILLKAEGELATPTGGSVPLRVQVKELVRGPQDPGLFRLPEGVRVMTFQPLAGRTPDLLKKPD